MSPTLSPRRLRGPIILLIGLAMAALCRPPTAPAADFGAKTSGNWSSSSTWTPTGGPPGASDNAYIGSTYPNGAASTATVLLTQNQQANAVVLGAGAGTSGTLNLGNFNLTASELYLGVNGSTGAVTRGSGHFDVGALWLSGSTLVMNANDRTEYLFLFDGSSVTTTATGNLWFGTLVDSGSTLTLGADLHIPIIPAEGVNIDVRGASSTLDAQGHKITVNSMSIGLGSGNARLLNRGDLALSLLQVANQNFDLTATDQVSGFYLFNGSTNFAPGAAVFRLSLQDGSFATTVAVGNITGEAQVGSGSTLTLGANLNVTAANGEGYVNLHGDNSTLDAQGHRITASQLFLGWNGVTNARLLNRGDLVVNDLLVANQNFNLTATDQVTNFFLYNASTNLGAGVEVQSLGVYSLATATTSTAGNITGSVDMRNYASPGIGSKLTLGADLILSGNLNADGHNVTIDAQGRNITANNLTLTYLPGNPGDPNISLLNDGAITIGGALTLSSGVQLELQGGNDSARSLFLFEGSGLRIKSASTGFTLTGTSADDLLFNGTSTLTLELNGSQPGWVFRWANPAGGDHIADLNSLIAKDMILFSATNGGQFNILSQNGYTYIVQPVPEPALILLFAAPIAIGLCRRRLAGRPLGP